MKNILLINGSLGSENGNTAFLINQIKNILAPNEQLQLSVIHLADSHSIDWNKALNAADGFIFTTGTYWDSWGSPLQKFLEDCTAFEGSNLLFNKPASVIVSMHSVGGKGVLSRLQGVLNTQGLMIPPMSGMVFALSTMLAERVTSTFHDDFWNIDDLQIVVHNLATAVLKKDDYLCWPMDKKDPKRKWINE